MQMYRYDNATTIYIHCLVFLCRKNSTNSRCKSGCIGNNINSRKRLLLTDSGNAEHTVFYKLNSGTILVDSYPSRCFPVSGMCKLFVSVTLVRLCLMLQQLEKAEVKGSLHRFCRYFGKVSPNKKKDSIQITLSGFF